MAVSTDGGPAKARPEDSFTEVTIRTRHPERYELWNLFDGSRWRLRADGHWSQVATDDGSRYLRDDLVEKVHQSQHRRGACRQGATCRKLATAKMMVPIFLEVLHEESWALDDEE